MKKIYYKVTVGNFRYTQSKKFATLKQAKEETLDAVDCWSLEDCAIEKFVLNEKTGEFERKFSYYISFE